MAFKDRGQATHYPMGPSASTSSRNRTRTPVFESDRWKKKAQLIEHLRLELEEVIQVQHRVQLILQRRNGCIEKTIRELNNRLHQLTHDIATVEVRQHALEESTPPLPIHSTRLPLREWKILDRRRQESVDKISILTYNVLSESHIQPNFYSHCPSTILDWSFRSKKIIRDIKHLSPDIVCLQVNQQFRPNPSLNSPSFSIRNHLGSRCALFSSLFPTTDA